MLGCCLVSFHFLWAILCPQAVLESRVKYIFALVAAGLYGHCPFVFVEDGRDGDGGGACHLNLLPSFLRPKKALKDLRERNRAKNGFDYETEIEGDEKWSRK